MSLVMLIILAVFHDGPRYTVIHAPSMAQCEAVKQDVYDHYMKDGPLALTVECHEVKANQVS